MMRLALCVPVIVAGCGGAGAPPPAPPAAPIAPVAPVAPVAPALTAEAAFLRWLEPFNASDTAGLAAFAELVAPEVAEGFPSVDDMLAFRDNTGGFDVTKTETSSAPAFVAIVKERAGDTFARVELEVDDAGRVRKFEINIVPTPAEHKPARLSESDAIAALEAELAALVAQDRFSGAVIVAKDGKAIFARAYGRADREHDLANTLDTRFRIGSMNKMFTATAILQLVQAGKLSLDDTVGELLPDYPNQDVAAKVTIHHLLTHTGGTGDIFGPEFDAHRLELRTLADYVTLYGGRALLHEPGAEERYSNYGFLLLGVIVEKLTKRSYYDVVQAGIFTPAKMTSTSSPFEDEPAKGRSVAYTRDLGGKRLTAWTDAKDTLPVRATSAGGGDSTVGDLVRFATALTTHRLLDAKHTELLTTRKTGVAEGGYAYGFGTHEEDGVRCIGHGGGAPGMNGDLQICDSGYTIAVLANLDPPAAGRISRFIKARLPVTRR